MNVFKLYLEERSKKKKLSNKHAIDLFMPFVATLSIYIVPIERSISFCLYNRVQLVRMHPIEYFLCFLRCGKYSNKFYGDANAICTYRALNVGDSIQ